MRKQELLKLINEELIENLYGFCYVRTNDSHEAHDLCSDIVLALVKTANSEGDVKDPYPFIWKIARNVYAKYSEKRKRDSNELYEGDSEEILPFIAEEESEDDNSKELLDSVYRRIAFLTKAYRDVMVMFYIEGLSTAKIAKKLDTSDTAIRQRLFSARKKVQSEVEEMNGIKTKPLALSDKNYVIWGHGRPSWDDPRKVSERLFSKHVIWLCRKKSKTAAEIAEELNVPTVYVEEELEILTHGEKGNYGMLRKTEKGKYIINFILLDKETVSKAHGIYKSEIPNISNVIADFISTHKEEYLAFPYLNKKKDLNLILWQQIHTISSSFQRNVKKILSEKYFKGSESPCRPFTIAGYEDYTRFYGGSICDASASNFCGYSNVCITNLSCSEIDQHFEYGHNLSNDPQIQMAVYAINGIDISSLSEEEKEHAAKAINNGYIYREGDMLYTKILVCNTKTPKDIFDITYKLDNGYFDENAEKVAEQISKLFKKEIPEHLMGEWPYANSIASLPVLDLLIEDLIKKGILTPPENKLGAEGCWMIVE